MRHLILAGLVVTLVVPSLAWAASVANPAAVVTTENYGFTMEVENQKVEIDNDLILSNFLVTTFGSILYLPAVVKKPARPTVNMFPPLIRMHRWCGWEPAAQSFVTKSTVESMRKPRLSRPLK